VRSVLVSQQTCDVPVRSLTCLAARTGGDRRDVVCIVRVGLLCKVTPPPFMNVCLSMAPVADERLHMREHGSLDPTCRVVTRCALLGHQQAVLLMRTVARPLPGSTACRNGRFIAMCAPVSRWCRILGTGSLVGVMRRRTGVLRYIDSHWWQLPRFISAKFVMWSGSGQYCAPTLPFFSGRLPSRQLHPAVCLLQ
jgi:hypothetical protein